MAVFFGHSRGAVKRLTGPWATPPGGALRVFIQGKAGRLGPAIITQCGVVQNGNFQFLHTINDQIFVYIFGDRISELHVSGVAFGAPCKGDPGAGSNGVKSVLDIYDAEKISVKGKPVIVSMGGVEFQSFLTGISVEVADAETLLGQFSFKFHSFPAKK